MRDAVRGTPWEIIARLDAGDVEAATQYLLSLHPADQADILAELTAEERQRLLDNLEPERLAALLEHFTPQEVDEVTPQIRVGQLAAALDETPADTAVDVLHQLEEAEAEAVLQAMDDATEVEALLEHEDESAGGIMTPHVITFRPSVTAENAIDYLRAIQPRADEPYYLYVVDAGDHLLGIVSLRDLVIARPDRTMRELMKQDIITTRTDTDQEEVLQTMQHYNLRALPVVDADRRLMGVATADDLIDVAQQEATEDMFRMVGMDEAEGVSGPVVRSVQRRLPWLLVSVLTVFAAAATVAVFEDTLERVAVIAVFLPIVVGISANAGGQTLTLVVRAMALGEYRRAEWRKIVAREIAIGTLNGVAIGLVVALVAWGWKGNGYLGLAIGLAMVGNMIVAGLAGVLVPSTLRLARADPALASSIFVTSVTDVMGYFLFLGLAALLIEKIA